MGSRFLFRSYVLAVALSAWGLTPQISSAACVWKVTRPKGGILYLGGSIHALRSSDYPLPAAYSRAFDASTHLVLEDDPNVRSATIKKFLKTGEYPKGDSLKNHIDPRVYDYLRRVFAAWVVPEDKIARLRPWALIMVLWSPSLHGLSQDLGIEEFLTRRARANGKPVTGLESFREHYEIISGLSDYQAELVLLLNFIPHESGTETRRRSMEAWRKGDVETIDRLDREALRDVPSFRERLIEARNRNWIPRIEKYLSSKDTYFVVVGAGHMGGSEGLLALLKRRGYRIEQL